MTTQTTALEAMWDTLHENLIVEQALASAERDVWQAMVAESMTMIHAQSLELDSVRAQLSALRDEIRRYTAGKMS